MRQEKGQGTGSDRRPDTSVQRKASGTPGKSTLTERLYDGAVQRRAAPGGDGAESAQVHSDAERGVSGAGSPLPHLDRIQRLFGPHHDVSGVRAHTGDEAAQSCEAIGANAYATGSHVAFRGAPDLHTAAHEAAHVVQQRGGVQLKGGVGQAGDAYEQHADAVADRVVAGESAAPLLDAMSGQGKAPCPTCGSGACECGTSSSTGATVVQREEFVGAPGKTATDKQRPLTNHPGELPKSDTPGGKIIPNSDSTAQNCAGDSVGQNKYINWPKLGYQAEDKVAREGIDADWEAAQAFVPSGCTRVSNDGTTVNNTRCKSGELELIVFLYRWPAGYLEDKQAKKNVLVYQSDFHMIGRSADSLPSGWHSKMDRRERVEDIRDPIQSLHDAYPHTLKKDREIVRLTFCGKKDAIKAK